MASGPAELARLLGANIDARIDVARRMLDQLEAEREALAAGDLAQLDAAARAKTAMTHELERLADDQRQLLSGFGHGLHRGTLQQALDWCGDESLQQREDLALDLMTQCNRNNQRNGILLQHRLDFIRRALGVLRNAQPDTALYGPQGRESSSTTPGLIGRG
ncbi:MAG: flagellar protein FlgN [Wenzhouxiangellaceae bacterium]|nr:flagellar protein FlgN [Wenzhouxiangellaceae bacterium]